MEQFVEELDSGEVHIRDRWQLELKSEFFPQPNVESSDYVQEFFLFIPNSLQINTTTYKKGQFYTDETNLIRYKTPEFTFAEILNPNNPKSPLPRILAICDSPDNPTNRNLLLDELKLFGNVVRSTLRLQVKTLIAELVNERKKGDLRGFSDHVQQFILETRQIRKRFAEIQHNYLQGWEDPIFYENLLYIDEFISRSILYYYTGLLDNLRLIQNKKLNESDTAVCEVILQEQRIIERYVNSGKNIADEISFSENEQQLYRSSLLNKFVLDALMLHTNRFQIEQRYQHWIGGFSAGIAMLIYFSLFITMGNVFVINSSPFILFTVIIYILKDRIKDWIKAISYSHAFKWFSDYATVIQSPDEKHNIGLIKETFSFVDENKLSTEIREARNRHFHEVLKTFQRPEDVLYYKRALEINNLRGRQARRYGLNIIFRFNIHRFLRKAANPVELYYKLDPETLKLQALRLPKVYHLDLIIRNRSKRKDGTSHAVLKKLRIVIDKNGIKRIEQLNGEKIRVE